MGGWSMSFWQLDGTLRVAPIKGWTSDLDDLQPDPGQEFAATYIVARKRHREGVHLTDRGGIFTYRPCTQSGRCDGVESFPCASMDYPGVERVVASARIDD